MASVQGIGGVFIKIADAEGWRAWYARVLGLSFDQWGGLVFPHPNIGYGVLSAFPPDSDYFAPSDAPFMLNLIVDDLDGVLAAVRAAGVSFEGPQDNDYGRFVWVIDPAGIKVELWQPPPAK
ncbi:MAG TPA: VOC family protein [Caulobacteraceae bacterium]|jgi:catechol 2,3-dioxygenase-like lactoylglutathione lyase family enzyme|nr:VOC family protein [Caulobacteraceae bacterium]